MAGDVRDPARVHATFLTAAELVDVSRRHSFVRLRTCERVRRIPARLRPAGTASLRPRGCPPAHLLFTVQSQSNVIRLRRWHRDLDGGCDRAHPSNFCPFAGARRPRETSGADAETASSSWRRPLSVPSLATEIRRLRAEGGIPTAVPLRSSGGTTCSGSSFRTWFAPSSSTLPAATLSSDRSAAYGVSFDGSR